MPWQFIVIVAGALWALGLVALLWWIAHTRQENP